MPDVALGLALLLAAVLGWNRTSDPTPVPPSTARHVPVHGELDRDGHDLFRFRSGFWLNLHHFLHGLAAAEADVPRRVRMAPADLDRVAGLGPDDERAFRTALATYRDGLASQDLLFDAELRRLGHLIAAMPDDATPDASALGAMLARALRTAAPVYRHHWWRDHDASNRRWVRELLPSIDRWGPAMVEGLVHAYATPWPEGPLIVDVCAYANWAGAYTDNDPARITIASRDLRNRGLVAFETVFHEAGHTIDHPISAAIRDAAERRDRRPPRDLWHAVIFYSTGEMVRRVVDASYEPYADRYGLWTRGPWPLYHEALRAHWPAHLDGKRPFEEVIDAMVDQTAGRPTPR